MHDMSTMDFEFCGEGVIVGGRGQTFAVYKLLTLPNRRRITFLSRKTGANFDPEYTAPGWPEDWSDEVALTPIEGRGVGFVGEAQA